MMRWLFVLFLSLRAFGQGTIKGTGTISGTGMAQVYILIGAQVSADAPFNTTIAVGGTVNLEAIGTFTDGTQQDITPACTWASSAPSKVSLGPAADPQIGTALAVGTSNLSCTQAGITSNSLTITVVNVKIATSSIPTGTVGTAYSTTITATGGTGPYTFTCNPACSNLTGIGLSLSSAGVLSGTPSSAVGSPDAFTVQATDSLSISGTGPLSLTVIAGGGCGPPLYSCASTSTSDPTTTLTPLFNSHAPHGVVNTGTPTLTTVNWVSGDNFSTCVPGQTITILTTAFTIATCDSSTLLHLTTNTNVFTGLAYVFPAQCIGDCQNSVKEDTTIPGHTAGTEKITRMTDGGTLCGGTGASVGNLTITGADNDRMISLNSTYAGFVTGGTACIYHITTGGGTIQVVNSGVPAGIQVGGSFGFGWTSDTTFYRIKNISQIWKGIITSDSTFTESMVVDFLGAGVCPGVVPFTPIWNSELGIRDDDNGFATSIGPMGGQGHADLIFSWDTTLGCSVANMKTGQAWNWSSIVCPGNTCSSSTTSLGTMSTASTSCWGSDGSAGHGIHSLDFTGNGTYILVSVTKPWTQGGCANNNNGPYGQIIWSPATLTNIWCANINAGPGNLHCGGHGSTGINKLITANSAGPNIRTLPNVVGYTQYAPVIVYIDQHGAWPHNCSGSLDDTCAWINASDSVTPPKGGVYTPHYLNNVIFAYWPYATYPPGQSPSIFAHTYSCGTPTAPYANCTDGGDPGFGPSNAIGTVSPKGDIFCWASSMLHGLGLDKTGAQRADAFCILLQ